ncbi:L-lactate permease [Nocardia otitidiscaviarum]|uniref:L-lactate permease n=1 Tax=Nocardia otitidiscaviarum TaxID=1823 RepID=UPI000694A56D|nr:L-lactate permease [Nocardia otitidiscaviarum]MBF6135667.1 L-lactate permease [Nocardia otitidiscaviarum]MBF6487485.1 L-lactate permease [Nocardia otitidiscaviarum]
MVLVAAVIPLVVVLGMITGLRRPAHWAAVAGVGAAVLLIGWRPEFALPRTALGSGAAGAGLLVLNAAAVMLPGVYLSQVLTRRGVHESLQEWVRALPLSGPAKVALVVAGIAPMVEALTGFGVSLLVTVPVLLALAPPATALRQAMLGMNIMPWGTLGLATVIGAALTDLPLPTLGTATAVTSALVFPLVTVWAALLARPYHRLRTTVQAAGAGGLLALTLLVCNHLGVVSPAGVLAGLCTTAVGLLLCAARRPSGAAQTSEATSEATVAGTAGRNRAHPRRATGSRDMEARRIFRAAHPTARDGVRNADVSRFARGGTGRGAGNRSASSFSGGATGGGGEGGCASRCSRAVAVGGADRGWLRRFSRGAGIVGGVIPRRGGMARGGGVGAGERRPAFGLGDGSVHPGRLVPPGTVLYAYGLVLGGIATLRAATAVGVPSVALHAGGASFALLASPGLPLLVAALVLDRGRVRWTEVRATLMRVGRPLLALTGFVVLGRLMVDGGMIERVGGAVAAAPPLVIALAAPALGMLGGFVTGSNVGGNVLTMPLQQQLAPSGLEVWFAAVQNSGAGHAVFTSLPMIMLILTVAGDRASGAGVSENALLRFGLRVALAIYAALAAVIVALSLV